MGVKGVYPLNAQTWPSEAMARVPTSSSPPAAAEAFPAIRAGGEGGLPPEYSNPCRAKRWPVAQLARLAHRAEYAVPHLRDMRKRRLLRRLTIVGGNRRQDRLVPPQAHLRTIRHMQVGLARLPQDIQDHVVQPQQDVIVGRPSKRVVERRVLIHKRPTTGNAVPLALQRYLQLGDMLRRRPQRGQSSNARLDELAHLQHLGHLALAPQDGRR